VRGVILANIVAEAWASLRGRRLQAVLSSFGIATGIAAVVLLVSIVSGMHNYMLETLGAVGGNVIQVRVSDSRSLRDPRGFAVSLRLDDLAALTTASPYYDAGSAENFGNGVIRTSRRSTRGEFFRGVTEQAFDVQNIRVGRGRLFLPSEYTQASRVAILGADLAQDLFNQESPIGQRIIVGDWPFMVVGVLDWVGDPAAGAPVGPDRGMFVPFRACADAFVGHERAGTFRLRLKDPDQSDAAVADTKLRLINAAKRRGETSGEFVVVNTVERAGELNLVLNAIKIVVGLVGGIGLFVGAVGVANVLLVSVRERRQEIGVRRAIGATRRAIFIGFLLEALAITLSGGLVGIAVAWALTKIALLLPQVPVAARPHISLVTGLTAVGLLTLVGLIAGVGPARRAAAVFPSEALRAD
jgi:putative ABC transport system permease protein